MNRKVELVSIIALVLYLVLFSSIKNSFSGEHSPGKTVKEVEVSQVIVSEGITHLKYKQKGTAEWVCSTEATVNPGDTIQFEFDPEEPGIDFSINDKQLTCVFTSAFSVLKKGSIGKDQNYELSDQVIFVKNIMKSYCNMDRKGRHSLSSVMVEAGLQELSLSDMQPELRLSLVTLKDIEIIYRYKFDQSIEDNKSSIFKFNELVDKPNVPKMTEKGFDIVLLTPDVRDKAKDIIETIRSSFEQCEAKMVEGVVAPASPGNSTMGPEYVYENDKNNKSVTITSSQSLYNNYEPFIRFNYRLPADETSIQNATSTTGGEITLKNVRTSFVKNSKPKFEENSVGSWVESINLSLYLDNKLVQEEKITFIQGLHELGGDVELLALDGLAEPLVTVPHRGTGNYDLPERYIYHYNTSLKQFERFNIQDFSYVNQGDPEILRFDALFDATGFASFEVMPIPVFMKFTNGKFINITNKNHSLLKLEAKKVLAEFENDKLHSQRNLYAYMVYQYLLNNKKEAWAKFDALYNKKDKKIRRKLIRQDIDSFLTNYYKYTPYRYNGGYQSLTSSK